MKQRAWPPGLSWRLEVSESVQTYSSVCCFSLTIQRPILQCRLVTTVLHAKGDLIF